MLVSPKPYFMENMEASAVFVRDNSTGKIHTINGPRVTIWSGHNSKGQETLTVSGYNHKTGRYTEKVKRLTSASLLGFTLNDGILRQWDVAGNTVG